MLQASEVVLLSTELSILNRVRQKLLSAGCFLYISKINEKKYHLEYLTSYLSSSKFQQFFVFSFILYIIKKLKTNKIGLNKTHSYAMHHKLKITLFREKINFHFLLQGKSGNKLLRDALHIFC